MLAQRTLERFLKKSMKLYLRQYQGGHQATALLSLVTMMAVIAQCQTPVKDTLLCNPSPHEDAVGKR